MFYGESVLFGRDNVTVETGKLAKQADGSIVYKTGKLVLLATVCGLDQPKENQDFFPLSCDYIEKMYAVGRFPGGYIKRESKPSENEILISRMIDRPIRPMFPDGYFADVQIVVQVLSADKDISTVGHAINAASFALYCSNIPFPKPISGVRIGRIDGKWFLNPSNTELVDSDVDLVVAGTEDTVVMIEGEAKELPSSELLEAIKFAQESIKQFNQFQQSFLQKLNLKKRDIPLVLKDSALLEKVKDFAYDKMELANKSSDKKERNDKIKQIKSETIQHFSSIGENIELKELDGFLEEIEYEVVRELVLSESVRADGRKPDEIRQISCEIGVLPSTHGSAVFTRGQTQSLAVVTLGTNSDNQKYDTYGGAKEKSFMLHYNFPGFSVGEVKRLSPPGRREIGHGNLAERSFKAVLPDSKDFPYTIRLVSEILESNGSSSMATVCSSSLALMNAGVPVHSGVAGIAMGMISNSGKYVILSDIAGLEDHFGDMDCKVAGTRKGITAFQMDCKVEGLSLDVLSEVFDQAEKGRFHILDKMEEVIEKSSSDLSENAPRILKRKIPKDKIGELIGPAGKNIKALIEETKVEDISIDQEGYVTILSENVEGAENAALKIDRLFEKVEIGKSYEGLVKRITDFGAFIEILPGKEGLCHVSKIDSKRVEKVRDFLSENQAVNVKVINIDSKGRINLSIKDAKVN